MFQTTNKKKMDSAQMTIVPESEKPSIRLFPSRNISIMCGNRAGPEVDNTSPKSFSIIHMEL